VSLQGRSSSVTAFNISLLTVSEQCGWFVVTPPPPIGVGDLHNRPTLRWEFCTNFIPPPSPPTPVSQYVLQKAYILRPDRRKLVILDHLSGVLLPGRLTLLLGPPSSGKSTLLKALAGALVHSGLKVPPPTPPPKFPNLSFHKQQDTGPPPLLKCSDTFHFQKKGLISDVAEEGCSRRKDRKRVG